MRWLVILFTLVGCSGKNVEPPVKNEVYPSLTAWKTDFGEWWKSAKPCPSGAQLFVRKKTDKTTYFCARKRIELPETGESQTLPALHPVFQARHFLAYLSHTSGIHGQLTVVYPNRRIDVSYFNGTVHGELRYVLSEGTITVGVEAGRLHGPSVMKSDKGNWSGDFVKGRLIKSLRNDVLEFSDGNGKVELHDGVRRVNGQFRDGYAAGKWVLSGGTMSGFLQFTSPGAGKSVFKEGLTKTEAHYKNWVEHGWRDYVRSGQWAERRRTRYKDGLAVMREYSRNHSLRWRVAIKADERDGKATWWWPNGIVRARGQYVEDVPSGKFSYFDRLGKPTMTRTIRDGSGEWRDVSGVGALRTVWGDDTINKVNRLLPEGLVLPYLDGYCDLMLKKGEATRADCEFPLNDKSPLIVHIKGKAKAGTGPKGSWELWVADPNGGKAFSGTVDFREGKLHGELRMIEGGNTGDALYRFKNGELHGPYSLRTSGKVEKGNYRMGKREGEQVWQFDKVRQVAVYKNNSLRRLRVSDGPTLRQSCALESEQLNCLVFAKSGKLLARGAAKHSDSCQTRAPLPGSEWPIGGLCAHGDWVYKAGPRKGQSERYKNGVIVK